jgi:hypothetical protein
VQDVERCRDVERGVIAHRQDVADLEGQAGMAISRGADHPRRYVDPRNLAARQLLGQPRGDRSITTTDIENLLVTAEGNVRERPIRHPAL